MFIFNFPLSPYSIQGSYENGYMNATLFLNTTNAASWMGIGFGSSMLNSEFIICLLSNKTVSTYPATTTGSYSKPTLGKVIGQGKLENGVLSCSFQKQTDTPTLVWAYGYSNFGKHVQYGSVSIESDILIPRNTASFSSKLVHGIGMMVLWLGIIPLTAFTARYLGSLPGWLTFSIFFQVLGTLACFIFFIIIQLEGNFAIHGHSVLGIVILTILGGMMVTGIVNVMAMSFESAQSIKKMTRVFHRYVGFSLLILADVQIGLGIQKVYPWNMKGGVGMWATYIALSIFWVILFVVAEIYWQVKIKGYSKIKQTQKRIEEQNQLPHEAERLLKALEIMKSDQRIHPVMKYTWEFIDEQVQSGKIFAIGPKNAVYDLTRWAKSHPGGQLILLSVAGTDISNDFFHEAEIDSSFHSHEKGASELKRSKSLSRRYSKQKRPLVKTSSHLATSTGSSTDQPSIESTLGEDDWHYIIKARRVHTHSVMAIQRLNSLYIGEMQDTESFNRLEFRRFALTNMSMITQQCLNPMFSMRFCLLYPFDTKLDEPKEFLPGQCVELEARVHGKIIRRYYTPLMGNLCMFEIMMKLIPEGQLTPFLSQQRPGERQFKIRGPFGRPLISPQIPLKNGFWAPQRLVFIGAGSGSTHMIQLIRYLLLPMSVRLIVDVPFSPVNSDEIKLSIGDIVMISHHFFDGWCIAQNLTTGACGVCPVACIVPRCGPDCLMLFVNSVHKASDVFGSMFFEAALLSYPTQFSIHHFISTGLDETIPGYIHNERLTDKHFKELIVPFCKSGQTTKVFTCGPDDFINSHVQMFVEAGFSPEDIRVMPRNKYIE